MSFKSKGFPQVHVLDDHPVIAHKLGLMRPHNVSTMQFRALAMELAGFLLYEASRKLPTEKKIVRGWAEDVEVRRLSGKKPNLVNIQRAAEGFVWGSFGIFPGARISTVEVKRDEDTLQPKLIHATWVHDLGQRHSFILDPMLATGGTMSLATQLTKDRGARSISVIGFLATPEGLAIMTEKHPDVPIFVAAIDRCLDENGFIIPGWGDAGDKLHGTK